jgi:hypothetical protein
MSLRCTINFSLQTLVDLFTPSLPVLSRLERIRSFERLATGDAYDRKEH